MLSGPTLRFSFILFLGVAATSRKSFLLLQLTRVTKKKKIKGWRSLDFFSVVENWKFFDVKIKKNEFLIKFHIFESLRWVLKTIYGWKILISMWIYYMLLTDEVHWINFMEDLFPRWWITNNVKSEMWEDSRKQSGKSLKLLKDLLGKILGKFDIFCANFRNWSSYVSNELTSDNILDSKIEIF